VEQIEPSNRIGKETSSLRIKVGFGRGERKDWFTWTTFLNHNSSSLSLYKECNEMWEGLAVKKRKGEVANNKVKY
jgi:hypothetical protein